MINNIHPVKLIIGTELKTFAKPLNQFWLLKIFFRMSVSQRQIEIARKAFTVFNMDAAKIKPHY